ncbi:MAG: S8 family serine peptidase [Planctomycetes bacterium]|nr:S8 family serine peptidase [Planctomycetota bacterium]
MHPSQFLSASAFVALLALAVPAQKPDAAPTQPSVPDAGAPTELVLKYGRFDPLRGQPAVPAALNADRDVRLFVVQFHGVPTEADRAAVRTEGGELHGYLPHNAYVVRMPLAVAAKVDALATTRFVGYYQPAWRLEAELLDEHVHGADVPVRRYNVVVVDKRQDKPALQAKIEALGGRVVDPQEGGLLMVVELSGEQLALAARLDEVLWIDRWSAPELDMDNARIQGGANYVESNLGYTGQGVRGHVYEGVEATHPDFTTPMTNVSSGGGADDHGHCTAGIVFGNGTSNAAVRGMAPDAVGFYTQYSSVIGSRNAVIGQVVNTHQCMFTTASWGDARTTLYTSISADSDDVIFDHRIPWTQSQSNAGNQQSRPQAWAKNIFSIGGVQHFNNSNPADDSWAAGGGSTGPAADGRIKPDLAAYYDAIGCSDRSGTAGYSSTNWYSSFGGTSGATPIVCGHNAIAIQMYAAGLFGNAPRVPGGTTFQNRPLAQTLKALQLANAQQYPFTASSSDNRREHVGWGFPSLRNLLDNSNAMMIVAEDDALTQGITRTYQVTVQPAEPELKICMTFVDPAGNPAAAQAAINDLTLRVTAPNGTVYWGNNGLTQGNYSTAGGSANTIDTVECVFVQAPAAGTWTVDVIATRISQDAHVATPGIVDATYALVCVGVNRSGVIPRFTAYGSGCGAASNNTLPETFYEQFGSFDLANRAIRFTPNGGAWSLSSTGAAFDPSYSNGLNLGDDQLFRNAALGFSFPLRGGGSTTAIDIDSNGWVGLVTGAHAGTDYTETVAEFLGNPARIAAFWDDLNPGTSGGGDVYFDTRPGVAIVTWAGIPEYPAVGSNTMQLQLYPNGSFVLAYGAVSSSDGLVGYSVGGGVADPGNNDISNPAGGPALTLGASGTPRLGTTLVLQIGQIPANAGGAFVNLGLFQQSIDLTAAGMPGCFLLTSLEQTLGAAITGSTASLNLPIPNLAGLVGQTLNAQGVVIAPGANTLGALTSNAGTMLFGT